MKLGFLTAMTVETGTLARKLGLDTELEYRRLYTLQNGDMLYISGIGRTNAAIGAAQLISSGCDAIVNPGSCGCTYPHAIGTFLIPKQFLDGDFYNAFDEYPKYDSAKINGTTEYRDDVLRIFTVSHFSTEPLDDKPYLVDMESYAIASICKSFGKPYLPIKIMSDSANEEADESFDNNVQKIMDRNADKIIEMAEIFRTGKMPKGDN